MSATNRSLVRRSRLIEAGWPTGLATVGAVLYLVGYIGIPAGAGSVNLGAVVILAGVSGWLGVRTYRAPAGDKTIGFQLERSILYVVTVFVGVRTLSGVGIDAYPAVYLLLAFLVTFQDRKAGIGAVAAALVLEWGSHLIGTAVGPAVELAASLSIHRSFGWPTVVSRTAFMGAFAGLSYAVHGTEVLERRRRHRREVEQERQNMLRQARELRLLNSGRTDAGADHGGGAQQMAVFDAVEAVQHTTYVSLSLLKTALGCHTCVLLWFDVPNETLHIRELVSDSDAIYEGAIEPARGVIGGITRRREAVKLDDLRRGFRGIPYYRQPQAIRHFLGVPVIESGHLRGVLCMDRIDDQEFSTADVNVAEEAAAYILRAVENERMFTSIEQSKYELGQFLEASRQLNGVLAPRDVYQVALDSIAGIAEYDLAAITVFDDHAQTHRIAAVDRAADFDVDIAPWEGQTFGPNSGLVAMVVENGHYLPYGGQVRQAQPVVFTDRQRLPGLQSMLVLPLIAHDEAIGTLVVGHRQAGQFDAQRREMLEVVGNQVAISLQNARLYAKMEQMATTDGLTGLANHRSFQSKLDEVIARHRRSEEPFGLLLTDIDHFKSVNDTHGHPVGDQVLRQVAGAFEESLREIDVPCRYGGEEFAIILEDTGRQTALRVAERLRQEVAALAFDSQQGPFQCTISLGVAIWSEDAADKQRLIDLTDQALYYSKDHGRDQVTSAAQL